VERHDAWRHRGFTLIEVLIALAIGGMVLLGAHALLTALADEEHRISATAAVTDAAANGERLLRALVGQIEVGTDESAPFEGTPAAARFTTWCEVPAGWQERCAVTLAIESAAGDSLANDLHDGATHFSRAARALVARFADGRAVVLDRAVEPDGLRYLESAAHGGHWFRVWGAGITAPLALGVLRGRDTLIVRIGERG
jgi:prepilin-type N-terminal cleavage/methylation domain-containing protein